MCSQQYRRVHILIWRRIANFVVCFFFSLSCFVGAYFFYCSIIDSASVMMMMMMLNGTISVAPFLGIALFRLCSHLPFLWVVDTMVLLPKSFTTQLQIVFFFPSRKDWTVKMSELYEKTPSSVFNEVNTQFLYLYFDCFRAFICPTTHSFNGCIYFWATYLNLGFS